MRKGLIGLLTAGALFLGACGCGTTTGRVATNTFGTILSPPIMLVRELDKTENPRQIPRRVINGTKDGVVNSPEALIKYLQSFRNGEEIDPSKPGRIVEYLEENKWVDIGTDIGAGAAVGAAVGYNQGISGGNVFTNEAAWTGAGIGGAAAGAASAVDKYIESR